jgi:predicted Ser/Thr protein kinase
MEDSPLGPRPGGMTELEERLLAASVHNRLFKQRAESVTIGRYRVLGRLGQGAMGVVYSALDEQLDRRIAIKLLQTGRGRGEARERLRREALALGRLSHPNVVAIHEIGEAEGQLFVAMELVEGVTLQAWLMERPRRVAEVLAAYVQAGRGLAAAHAVGLVHRDFKPENILIGSDGRVRVVDFGLARQAFDTTNSHTTAHHDGPLDGALTATGALLGTPAYMAPEQAGGDVAVDARSDQFSFCVALYEALYGERPFGGATFDAYLAEVAAGRVRRPTPGRRVPRTLRRALLRGLRHVPGERWPDMHTLLARLSTRSRARGPVAALVVVCVLGLAWWLVARARVDEQATREAVAQARVDAFAGELTALLGAEEVAGAERRIADLVASPEIRSTEAAAGLWLRWAGLLAAQERPSAPAWAHAYARTRDAEVRREALLGLARSFHGQHDSTGLAHALALISAEAPELADTPEVQAMRFKIAAHHRDLAEAQRLAAGAGPEALAVAPVLAALRRSRQ